MSISPRLMTSPEMRALKLVSQPLLGRGERFAWDLSAANRSCIMASEFIRRSMSMKKSAMAIALGILVLAAGLIQARTQTAPSNVPDTVRISGRVTDFEGRPIEGALIELKNSRFNNAAEGNSDKDGRYSLSAPKGTYMALAAVKDYQVKSLEYWAWNIPAEQDLEINPRFDRLEVYAINAWRPQGGYPSYQIYFRPMSLTRTMKKFAAAGGMENLKKLPVMDIAPELTVEDIQVAIDGQPVKVLQVDKVREAGGPNQYLFAYLIQVGLPEKKPAAEYFPITITIIDRTTGEKGEGCLFFRPPHLM